ncbi:hypothetical protein GGQ84_000464 [Desulfitispora alkaliphila]|uniref:class I SAM-dependent methyltransferase n=1 Tax=Desulfitispora alkaliphila TaxID=622674 RepID=UPI003D23F092
MVKIIPGITKLLENICAALPVLVCLKRKYYKQIVENEVKQGVVSEGDRVLCIGGGPLPCTAMEIASNTGAEVTVIDNDSRAVSAAKRIVRHFGLDNRVKVFYGDGCTFDASKYSVVHIALQAYPKDKILKNVWKTAPSGAKVLVRNPRQGLRGLYHSMNQYCDCNHCKVIGQKNCTMKATILFTKDWGSEALEAPSTVFNRSTGNNSTTLAG